MLADTMKAPGISVRGREHRRHCACSAVVPGGEGGLPTRAGSCRSGTDVGLGRSAVADSRLLY